MRIHPSLLLSCLAATACATPVAASNHAPPSSATFSYSAPPPSVAVPAAPPVRTGLIVRPDLAVFPVVLVARAENCPATLESLEKASTVLSERLQAEWKGVASLHLRAMDVAELRGSSSKALAKESGDPTTAISGRVEGTIEVTLTPSTDYWTRMKLLVKVSELVTTLFPPPPADSKTPARLEVVLGASALRVQEAERFRETLTQTWSKRVREFIAATQGPGAKLLLTSCDPPGKILQSPISLEEIQLQLPVNCRLGVAATER